MAKAVDSSYILGIIDGKRKVIEEVLEWLDENFFTGEIEGYYSDVPEHIVQGKFDDKEHMIQSFKDQFKTD